MYGTDVFAVTVILTILVVALAAAVMVLLRQRSADRATISGLTVERDAASERVAALETRVSELDERLVGLESSLAEERSRVAHETQRAVKAEDASAEATRRADEAEQLSRSIESDLRMTLSDPTPLGALEALRISRLWQEHVPGPGEPLPVDTRDEVHAALVVLAEASREESGTTVDISWQLDQAVAPGKALSIVRIAEELMAGARNADSLSLTLTAEDGSITVTARTDPPVTLSRQLASILETTGWITTFEAGEVVLRL